MIKEYTSLGMMSGTSGDGVDASVLFLMDMTITKFWMKNTILTKQIFLIIFTI